MTKNYPDWLTALLEQAARKPNLTADEVHQLVSHTRQLEPFDAEVVRALLTANTSVPLTVARSLQPEAGFADPEWVAHYCVRTDVSEAEAQSLVDAFTSDGLMTFLAYANKTPRLRRMAVQRLIELDPGAAPGRMHWLSSGEDFAFAIETLAAADPRFPRSRLGTYLAVFVSQLPNELEELVFDHTEHPAVLTQLAARCVADRGTVLWASTPQRVTRLVDLVVLQPTFDAELLVRRQWERETTADAVVRLVGAYATLAQRQACATHLEASADPALMRQVNLLLNLGLERDNALLMSSPVAELDKYLRSEMLHPGLGTDLARLDDTQFATLTRLAGTFSGTLDELLMAVFAVGVSAGEPDQPRQSDDHRKPR